jgi:hypothetical protein
MDFHVVDFNMIIFFCGRMLPDILSMAGATKWGMLADIGSEEKLSHIPLAIWDKLLQLKEQLALHLPSGQASHLVIPCISSGHATSTCFCLRGG